MGVTIIHGQQQLDVPVPSGEPVLLEFVWLHRYVSKGKGTRGCKVCNLAKTHRDHLGAPPSFNVLGSGDQQAYQSMKKSWQAAIAMALEASGLSRGLERVVAEGRAIFGDHIRRDQGNHRFMVEKALGDALVFGTPAPDPKRKSPEWWERTPGGWLEDDDWDRYEFGGFAKVIEPPRGTGRTELLIFPTGGA